MIRWFALAVLLGACDSGKRPTPPPVAPPRADARTVSVTIDAAIAADADLSLEPGAAPNCSPAEHDALVQCLMERSACSTRVEVLPQRRPDLELVRTIYTGCADTYVIAKHADRWYAIAELYYEQAHGRRNGDLKVRRVRDTRIADKRVTQIDYSTDEVTGYIDDSAPDGMREEHTHEDLRMSCTWPSDDVPTCVSGIR